MGNDTALVRVQQQPAVPAPFEPGDLGQAFTLAESLSQASLLPQYLRGKPHDVFMTLLLGRDLGLTAMQAITGIHVIEGRPTLSAQTAVALVKRSAACKYFRQVESTDEVATYETHRQGEASPVRMSFSIRDAQRAGLTGKGNWSKFPSAMLRARASMALARDVYPDVVANIYDPEELDRGAIDAQVVMTAPPQPPISAQAQMEANRSAGQAKEMISKPPAAPASPPASTTGSVGQGTAAAGGAVQRSSRTAPCGTCGGSQADHAFGAIDATCPAKTAPVAGTVREAIAQTPPQEHPAFEADEPRQAERSQLVPAMAKATTRAELEETMRQVADLKREGKVSGEELEQLRQIASNELARIKAGLVPGTYPEKTA